MRVKLKGLRKVKRKLVSGQYRVHYYAWRGGPKMKSEYGTPAFVEEFHAHHKARAGEYTNAMLGYMIQQYLKSPEGMRGKIKTVSERQRYIAGIKGKFGTLPLVGFKSPEIRMVLYEWRDEMIDTPRTADEYMKQFGRLLKWGVKRGYVATNPLEGYEGIYEANRADMIWRPDDVRRLLANCPKETGWVFRAAIHLGARKIDIRKLKWSNIKDHETVYKPKKGEKYNRIAKVPHTPYFRALLAELPRRSIFVFTNTQGMPWGESAINSADKRARQRAGLTHLHYHDLRGTAATIKASRPGTTTLDIARMLGWSVNEVETMLNRYVSWNDVNEDWSWAING